MKILKHLSSALTDVSSTGIWSTLKSPKVQAGLRLGLALIAVINALDDLTKAQYDDSADGH
jgi:uncharacterized protein YjgD (DUF1641 family)